MNALAPKLDHLRADSLVRRVAQSSVHDGCFIEGARVLALVSGGSDSVALLLILHAIAAEHRMGIDVLHVKHGVRGEAESEAAGLTDRLCQHLGVSFHLRELGLRFGRKRSEETMRRARYALAREVASEEGIPSLVMGHTQDDLAETVLHRAIRGTGLTGLAAMLPVTEQHGFRFVRPLLGETREGLRMFLTDHQVAWHEDATNDLLNPTRNRIRHLVRPLLKREINARADEALARLAQHAAEDDAELERAVDRAIAAGDMDLSTEQIPLDWLRSLSPSLVRRVLRRWLMQVSKSELPPHSRHIEEITRRLALSPGPPKWSTFRGLTLAIRRSTLAATLPPAMEARRWPQWHRDPTPLPSSGVIPLTKRWHIRVEPLGMDFSPAHTQTGRFVALIDPDRVKGELIVRRRQPGDLFRPLGFPHRKPLRRFMTDARVPRHVRAHLPIVCDDERIVWVTGCRIADAVKITDETRRALRLAVEPSSQ